MGLTATVSCRGCCWHGCAQRRYGRSAANWSSGGRCMSLCTSSAWRVTAAASEGIGRDSKIRCAGSFVVRSSSSTRTAIMRSRYIRSSLTTPSIGGTRRRGRTRRACGSPRSSSVSSSSTRSSGTRFRSIYTSSRRSSGRRSGWICISGSSIGRSRLSAPLTLSWRQLLYQFGADPTEGYKARLGQPLPRGGLARAEKNQNRVARLELPHGDGWARRLTLDPTHRAHTTSVDRQVVGSSAVTSSRASRLLRPAIFTV